MKIEYRSGDMFSAPECFLVHGCNAQGVMASGVAKAMRTIYPEAFTAYIRAYRHLGLKLGEIIWADCKQDGRIIANAITQNKYGRDGARYVDYDAVRKVMGEINTFCGNSGFEPATIKNPISSAVMPLIGAGFGGGEWSVISAIIEEMSEHFQPIVYLHDGKMPTT